MRRVGGIMTASLTLPMVMGMRKGISAAMDFESSMSKIEGLVGVARSEVQGMEADIIRLAGKTARAPQELADAMFFITSAGNRGAQAVELLEMSARAATAGLGDTKVVAHLASSAIAAYGKENLNAAEAMDVLVGAVREGKAEASELATSMGQVLPIASELGVTFDQVGAATAAMTRTGTDAATASTQLRQILASLIKPTNQAEQAMADMGTSSAELRRSLREDGLVAVLGFLREQMEDNEQAMSQVFPNIRALSGALDIMGANAEDNIQIFDRMKDSTGLLDSAFDAAANTAKFEMEQALAALSAAGIQLGKDLMPIATSIINAVRSMAESFSELDDEQRQTIIRMGLYVAAAGPVIGVLGQMLIWTNRLNVAMKALNVTMLKNPWVLAAAGVVTLGMKIRGVIKDTREFNSILEEALSLTDAEGTVEEFKAIEKAIEAVNDKIHSHKLQLQAGAGGAFNEEQIEQLEEQRTALRAIGNAISEKIDAQHQAEQADQDAAESAEQAAESVNAYADALERIKPIVDNIPPVDEIIDPIHAAEIEQIREEYREFQNALFDVLTHAHELPPALEEVEEKADDAGRSGTQFANTMGNALSQAALHGRDLSSVLDNLIKQFASRALVTGLAALITGGSSLGGSSFLGSVLGFAGGGNPPTGRASLVGEQGPELIVPRSASTVIPNHQMAGGSRVKATLPVNVQIDNEVVFRAVQNYEIQVDA